MSHIHIDSDDEAIDDIDTLSVLRRLKRPLFKRPPACAPALELCDNIASSTSSEAPSDNVTEGDILSDRIQLAVTVNPDPFAPMNKCMYKLYSHDKQRAMLTRIENAARRDIGEIKCVKLCFEICPKLRQVHYHAWYDLPRAYVAPIEVYITKRVSRKNGPSWRAFQSKEIYDEKGWLEYITKDEKPQLSDYPLN